MKEKSVDEHCVEYMQEKIVNMVTWGGKFEKMKISHETDENQRMVVSHEIGRKYLLQVYPGKSGDHIIVHDINNVVPVDKFVAERGGICEKRNCNQKQEFPIQQFILFNKPGRCLFHRIKITCFSH